MKNDYLWDGSGKPDPELQLMENSLARFRYSGETPEFPAAISKRDKSSPFSFLPASWNPRFASAALLTLALVASGLLLRFSPTESSSSAGWEVARLAGAPRIGHFSLASDASKAQLRVG